MLNPGLHGMRFNVSLFNLGPKFDNLLQIHPIFRWDWTIQAQSISLTGLALTQTRIKEKATETSGESKVHITNTKGPSLPRPPTNFVHHPILERDKRTTSSCNVSIQHSLQITTPPSISTPLPHKTFSSALIFPASSLHSRH